MTSVWSCHSLHSLPYIGRDAGSTCISDSANRPSSISGVGVLLHLINICIVDINYKLVYIVVIIAVLRGIINQHALDFLVFRADKIFLQRIHKLILSDFLLLIY